MQKTQRTLALVGLTGTIIAFLLLLTALFVEGAQDPFQQISSTDAYRELLQSRAFGLRVSFTLDTIFIVVYVSFFALLATVLRTETNQILVNLALGAMILTGVLDAIENAHIMAMLGLIEKNLPIQLTEISFQMAASQVKFLSSYLALFLLGIVFPKDNWLGKFTAYSLLFVQLPLGALIFTVPQNLSKPLVLMRAIFFIFGFLLPAKIYWDKSRQPEIH